ISAKQGLTPDQLSQDYVNMLGHPVPLRTLGFRKVLDLIWEMPDVVYIDYLGDLVADDTTRGIVERVGVGFFSPCYQQHRPMVLPWLGHTPPALPAQLRRLLSQGAVGLSELETAFALRYDFHLGATNYGFYSTAEMLAAANDLVAVTQSQMGSLLSLGVEVAPLMRTGPKNNSSHRSRHSQRVPVVSPSLLSCIACFDWPVPLEEELRQRILENGLAGTVVAQNGEGISIHDLPAEYKGHERFTFHCPLFPFTYPEGPSEGGEALNPSSTGYYFSCRVSLGETGGERKARPTPTWRKTRSSTLPSTPFTSLRTLTPWGPRELVAMLVEHVESLSHFYIRFDESQEPRALENRMIKMRRKGEEATERYRDPAVLGMCAAWCPQGIWFYHVVVHRVLSHTQAEVFHVDISLKFLKSCCSELPAQAVPSSLAGIKPFALTHPLCVLSLLPGQPERTLVVELHSYHAGFLQLFLCNRHTQEDVYIHSALQGHGLSCLCGQFNPVSFYLGKGVFGEGIEIEDEDPTLEPCPDATTSTTPQRAIIQPQPKSSPSHAHAVQNNSPISQAHAHAHRQTD
uniref:HTH OST-type domain-containing protein n=1 Tax=Salmo trutta TaxID=8032 RepID=A0A673XYS6_SALTR